MTVDLEPGAKWRQVDRHGRTRRYVVERAETEGAGTAVSLSCLEPPHPPVEGYKGGHSREARVWAVSLWKGRDGWLPGHE